MGLGGIALAELLAGQGVATFEFPHVMRLIEGVQFDTIYHEHFFYLSLYAAEQVMASAGLRVRDRMSRVRDKRMDALRRSAFAAAVALMAGGALASSALATPHSPAAGVTDRDEP